MNYKYSSNKYATMNFGIGLSSSIGEDAGRVKGHLLPIKSSPLHSSQFSFASVLGWEQGMEFPSSPPNLAPTPFHSPQSLTWWLGGDKSLGLPLLLFHSPTTNYVTTTK